MSDPERDPEPEHTGCPIVLLQRITVTLVGQFKRTRRGRYVWAGPRWIKHPAMSPIPKRARTPVKPSAKGKKPKWRKAR